MASLLTGLVYPLSAAAVRLRTGSADTETGSPGKMLTFEDKTMTKMYGIFLPEDWQGIF